MASTIYNPPYSAGLDELVRDLKSTYTAMWVTTSTEFSSLEERFTHRQQLSREKQLDEFVNDTVAAAAKKCRSEDETLELFEDISAAVRGYIADFFVRRHSNSETSFLDDFSRVARHFISEARRFDSQVNMDDIHQALRNVWIVNSIQFCLGREVSLTPSAFAYSMLYPYTDNYLDDPVIPDRTKREFIQAVGRHLAGEKVKAGNPNEHAIFDLLGIIEKEYPRSTNPGVYQSLLAIHRAQERSLSQQDRMSSACEAEILGITFEKGGTSVLADGYLANGTLTEEDARFVFGYGILLQMIDDLQDLEEDLRSRHVTIFSQAASRRSLDNVTNRLLRFLTNVLDSADRLALSRTRALRELIERSCVVLVLEAVAQNKHLYGKDYARMVEPHSPLRLNYMRSMRRRMKEKYNALIRNGVAVLDRGPRRSEVGCGIVGHPL